MGLFISLIAAAFLGLFMLMFLEKIYYAYRENRKMICAFWIMLLAVSVITMWNFDCVVRVIFDVCK